MEETQAYPLHWPLGRQRTKAGERKRAAFNRKITEWKSRGDGSNYQATRASSVTLAVASQRLLREVSAFTVSGRTWVINPSTVIVSSNVPVRRDGMPYSNAREPDDAGVAVYFVMKGQKHCLTCDKWDRVADNVNAIAKHIEAMRGQLRWGVADVAAMFAGFKALPGAVVTAPVMTPDEAMEWVRKMAGFAAIGDDNLKDAFRACAMKLHPDPNGGDTNPDWHVFQSAKTTIEAAGGAGTPPQSN